MGWGGAEWSQVELSRVKPRRAVVSAIVNVVNVAYVVYVMKAVVVTAPFIFLVIVGFETCFIMLRILS